MSSVAGGLRMMYAGLCIVILAVVAGILIPQISIDLVMQMGGPIKFIQMIAYAIVAGEVLYFIGMLICLAVPRQTGAAPAMYPAVLIAFIGVGLQLWSTFGLESMVETLPLKLVILIHQGYVQWGIFTLSTCLFLLSLRTLNTYINSPRNATRAWTTFWATLVLMGLLVALNLVAVQATNQVGLARGGVREELDLLRALSIGTLLFAIVWLILYGNTLIYTARAVSDYERRGGRPADA